MAPNDRPLDPELRKRLKALLDEGRSLRELANEVGISYFLIFKGVRGRKIRPATERSIREALERALGGETIGALGGLVRALGRELGEKRARKVAGVVRRIVREAYEVEGRMPPRGLVDDSARRPRRAAKRSSKRSRA